MQQHSKALLSFVFSPPPPLFWAVKSVADTKGNTVMADTDMGLMDFALHDLYPNLTLGSSLGLGRQRE